MEGNGMTKRELILNLLNMDHIGAPHLEEEFHEAKAKLLEAINGLEYPTKVEFGDMPAKLNELREQKRN